MALRVRKLARELEVSPDDLLRLMQEMGFDRYRSPEDLVADDVVARVRREGSRQIARGRFQAPAPRPAVAPQPTEAGLEAAAGEDWMSGLVPGVVRPGARPPRRAPPPVPTRRPPPAPAAGGALAEERAETAREALAAERKRLEAARDALAAERSALEEGREELERARQALVDERRAQEQSAAVAAEELRQRSLLGLLEQRGLSGVDECERAVAALAAGRALGRALGTLVPSDPEAWRRLLADRLLLASGPVPDDPGPTVVVAPSRADLRPGAELDRQLARLGEALLLDGCRRVVVAGLHPRLQLLLQAGLDRRVELQFRPGGVRDAAQVAEELPQADLVVLWNVEVTPGGRSTYLNARKRFLELRGRTLGDLLESWTSALQRG